MERLQTTTIDVVTAMCVFFAFTLPVQADHGCNGTVTQIDTGPQTYYLDDRSEPGERNHWLYRETNGIEGLQSGGHFNVLAEPIEPAIAETCAHRDYDDLIIVLLS